MIYTPYIACGVTGYMFNSATHPTEERPIYSIYTPFPEERPI
jgi:hypothetical protein